MTSKRLEQARAAHQKWLELRGLTRKQIKSRRDPTRPAVAFPDLSVQGPVHELSNGFAKSGFVNTPMSNRYREAPHVRTEIERKAKSLAPAYNKGGVQYISPGDDPRHIGKKTSSLE